MYSQTSQYHARSNLRIYKEAKSEVYEKNHDKDLEDFKISHQKSIHKSYHCTNKEDSSCCTDFSLIKNPNIVTMNLFTKREKRLFQIFYCMIFLGFINLLTDKRTLHRQGLKCLNDVYYP